MLSEMGMRTVVGEGFNGEDAGKDLERELNLYRSGSAPPTVEGSITAVGRLLGGDGTAFHPDVGINGHRFLSEEELRSDPSYLSYYYSHVNLNPRLPPPTLSKEDWRFTQRLQAGSSTLGGIGDQRKYGRPDEGLNQSVYSPLPRFNAQEENDSDPRKWLGRGNDGLIGLSGLGLDGRQKSIADIFQVI